MDSSSTPPLLPAPPPSPCDPSYGQREILSIDGVYLALSKYSINISYEQESPEHGRVSRDNLPAYEGSDYTDSGSAGLDRGNEDGIGTYEGPIQETQTCQSDRPWVDSPQANKDHPAAKKRKL